MMRCDRTGKATMLLRECIRCASSLTILAISGCTQGPSASDVISNAEHQILMGRADVALRPLQEARVENPRSEELLFEIAYTQGEVAALRLESGTAQEAEEMFREAQTTFSRLTEGEENEFGDSAAFNVATTLLRLDAVLEDDERYAERLDNLNLAIEILIDLLETHPTFDAAQNNLDYARYKSSLLLRDPPEENDEEENEEENESPATTGFVDSVTTQIPEARAEVVNGSTIVLHLPSRKEAEQ